MRYYSRQTEYGRRVVALDDKAVQYGNIKAALDAYSEAHVNPYAREYPESFMERSKMISPHRVPYVGVETYDSGEHIAHHLTNNYDEPEEQPGEQMSFYQGDPAKIDSAFADHSMSGKPASTALAIAYNNPSDTFTIKHPMPSDSLSQNSSPIVKEMLEQGRLTPNPWNESGEVTNGIEHRGKYSNTLRLRHANEIMNEEEGWQEVPEHEIRAAHNLLQDVVHQRKERRGRGAGSRTLQREDQPKPMQGQLSLEFPSQ